jgi:hypothetical protein
VVPPLLIESPADDALNREAHARRAARLASRAPR